VCAISSDCPWSERMWWRGWDMACKRRQAAGNREFANEKSSAQAYGGRLGREKERLLMYLAKMGGHNTERGLSTTLAMSLHKRQFGIHSGRQHDRIASRTGQCSTRYRVFSISVANGESGTRSTFQRLAAPTARARTARSTLSTRSPSTRLARYAIHPVFAALRFSLRSLISFDLPGLPLRPG